MATVTETRPASKPTRKPLTVELVLTINGQAYHVEPIAPSPDNVKAYRLVKRAAAETVYDVSQTTAGLVECDCPSYEVSFRGNGLETCKHGRALIMCGLVDYPDFHAPADDARAADDDAREKLAAIAAAEAAVWVDAERPAPVVEAPIHPTTYDPQWQAALAAVSKGNAIWIDHRHLHTSDPLPAPKMTITSSDSHSEPRLVDDDGTPLETPAEMDARHRAEHEVQVAELMEGNPFLPACCPDDEVLPCAACLSHDGPADLSDDGWDDGFRWVPSADEPPARSLAEQVDVEAAHYRGLATPFGDLIARVLETLSARVKFLGASDVATYEDRLTAMLDQVRVEAEARQAAAC